jgi:hypothetical protein
VKEHPLYCWTKRELIRPAKKAVRKVSGRAGSRPLREVRGEIQARERRLRELREQMRELEAELEQAPRRSREKERLRQITRQRILEQQKVLNVSLVVSDPRASEDYGRAPLRRSRNQARREARLMFFLLLPVCVALCYFTVKLLLQ